MSKEPGGDLPNEFLALSPKLQTFVLKYLEHHNATKAAKEAGYSEKSAYIQGTRFVNHHEGVQAALRVMRARDQAKMVQDYDVSREKVTFELAKVAFSNIGRVVRWSGNTFSMQEHSETSETDTAAIKSISYSSSENLNGRSESFNLSMYDKVKALELLGKSLGMFEDDASRDSTATDALKERMAQLRNKVLRR